jgi:hypothetical protein
MPSKTMTKTKRTSNLGEQLAELANVRPADYDPEALNGRSDEEDDESDSGEARDHYLSVG